MRNAPAAAIVACLGACFVAAVSCQSKPPGSERPPGAATAKSRVAERASEAEAGPAAKAVAAEAGPADVQLAQQLYAGRCQVCHGAAGKGDGPMAGSLRPAPRSFADHSWQAQTPDAAIAAIILRGGASMGRSAAMPAAPDLATKPNVVAGLVKLVRHFGE